MNSTITCSLEPRALLMAVVLKKLWRTSMPIVSASSSSSQDVSFSVHHFSFENLITEYERRYGEVHFYHQNGWDVQIVSLIEDIIDAHGEEGMSDILDLCEAIVDGREPKKKSVFSVLFSCFPSHIFLGSTQLITEQGV